MPARLGFLMLLVSVLDAQPLVPVASTSRDIPPEPSTASVEKQYPFDGPLDFLGKFFAAIPSKVVNTARLIPELPGIAIDALWEKQKRPALKVKSMDDDMPSDMQNKAIRIAIEAMKKHDPEEAIARHIKEEFDQMYGTVWHCIVGTNFGSFVAFSPGRKIFFKIDELEVLLFQTRSQ